MDGGRSHGTCDMIWVTGDVSLVLLGNLGLGVRAKRQDAEPSAAGDMKDSDKRRRGVGRDETMARVACKACIATAA